MKISLSIGVLAAILDAIAGSTFQDKKRIVLPLNLGPAVDVTHFKSFMNSAVPLSVINLWQFYVEMQVGVPPQNVSIVIDTTIRETFLPSTNCQSFGCLPMLPNAFNPDLSETRRISQDRFELLINDYNYDFTKVIGNLTLDTFTLGPMAFLGDFLLVDETDPPKITTVMYNGRFGLGLISQNDPPSLLPSIFQDVYPHIVSWYYFPFEGYGVVGGLEIGSVNYDLVDMNTWQTFPNVDHVNGGNQWAFPLNNIGINGQSLGSNGYALIDTSTPLIIGPLPLINTLNAMIGFAQHGGKLIQADNDPDTMTYQIPCNATALLPDVDVMIASVAYKIPSTSYLIGDGNTCISVLRGMQDAASWVVGMSMFKGIMMALDYENGTISLGILKPLPGL